MTPSAYFFLLRVARYRFLSRRVNSNRNRNISIRKRKTIYSRLNLEHLSDHECKSMFRFTLSQIRRICSLVQLGEVLRFSSLSVKSDLAVAMIMHRLSFPRRQIDMSRTFGMSRENISKTLNRTSELLFQKFKHGIEFDERQFSKPNCERFSKAIYETGSYYTNIIGFIDGKIEPTCQPTNGIQPIAYNGWKDMPNLKYQTIFTPDGIISSLYGLYYDRNDSPDMFNKSRLSERLERHFGMVSPETRYSFYGDEAYIRSKHVTPPWTKPFRFDYQERANTIMSRIRKIFELENGKAIQLFSGVKWQYGDQKSKPALKYMLSDIFKNFHTILNGSSVTSFFKLKPPSLEEYIDGLMRERSQNDILE